MGRPRAGAAAAAGLLVCALLVGGADGVATTFAGNTYGDGDFADRAIISGPTSAVLSGDHVLATDNGHALLRSYDVASGQMDTVAGVGTLSQLVGSPLLSGLNNPTCVVPLVAGTLICDYGSNRMLLMAPSLKTGDTEITVIAGVNSGTACSTAEGAPATVACLLGPRAAAATSDASLVLFTEEAGHRIRRIDGGLLYTYAGNASQPGFVDGPLAAARFRAPRGISLYTPDGSVAVADTGNHAIRLLRNGSVVTIAGDGTPGATGDGGLARFARLSSPSDVAFSPSGFLFIADSNNCR